MLRKDREVKNTNEINDIIKSCKVMRVAMNDENGIYILPVNFGSDYSNDKITFYFHGAKRGKKHDIISKGNVKVGIEMDCNHQLVEGENPKDCTYKYSSVIAKGLASIIGNNEEKEFALNCLMLHDTGKSHKFTQKDLDCVEMFKIEVTELSAKQNI